MSSTSANNKRVAKNTIILYFRMFLTMGVSLFTSRIILDALGASDYGLYNVVGGVVSMLSFINAGLSSATQRFITFALGKGELDNQKNVFFTSVLTHFALSVIILILAETLGLWFVNSELNFPVSRTFAANWVYQCSVLTFFISLISVPYNSTIIAHERMSIYAYVSIIDVLAKLGVAYLIYSSVTDKLIQYATLLLLIQIFNRVFYGLYCKRNFPECSYKFRFDKNLFKEMFSFAGWSVLGNLGFSLRHQGNNIVINIFYGTVVNAARGIAAQISGAVNMFARNFTVAIHPQITKYYAAGDFDKCQQLLFVGAKFSFFLMVIIGIPIITNIQPILELWLKDVPQYTSFFAVAIIIGASFQSMSSCSTIALQATGNIKLFQICICVLMFSEIPIAYLMLKYGMEVKYAIIPTVVSNFLSILVKGTILKKNMPEFNLKFYLANIVFKSILVAILSLICCLYIDKLFTDNLSSTFLSIAISFLITIGVISLLGLNKREREFAIAQAKRVINKIVQK